MNTKNINIKNISIQRQPIKQWGVVNQNLLLLGEKLEYNKSFTYTQKVDFSGANTCHTPLSFAIFRTSTRNPTGV